VLYTQLSKSVAPNRLAVKEPQKQVETTVTNNTGNKETENNTEGATPDQEEETDPDLELAPDFTVYDADGNEVHLSDFIGKPVVLNFWASWCGPCKSEMPDFDEKYKELGEDIHFLMVNLTDGSRETVKAASAFIDGKGYTFPVLFDKDSDAATTYGIYSIPTTIFIDAKGYAIAQATGAIDADTLQRGIDMITSK